MTRTLKLTPAEWEVLQRNGTAWIVREGMCGLCIEGGLPHDDIGPCVPNVEPLELVAAAAPCETCDDTRVNWDDMGCPCPDCRITLMGECPKCPGTVILGCAYVGGEVLPITHWGSQDRPDGPQLMFDVSMDGTPVIDYWDGKRTTEISDELAHYNDPAALVGRYALKVRLA